jgi:hypothetical protein
MRLSPLDLRNPFVYADVIHKDSPSTIAEDLQSPATDMDCPGWSRCRGCGLIGSHNFPTEPHVADVALIISPATARAAR